MTSNVQIVRVRNLWKPQWIWIKRKSNFTACGQSAKPWLIAHCSISDRKPIWCLFLWAIISITSQMHSTLLDHFAGPANTPIDHTKSCFNVQTNERMNKKNFSSIFFSCDFLIHICFLHCFQSFSAKSQSKPHRYKIYDIWTRINALDIQKTYWNEQNVKWNKTKNANFIAWFAVGIGKVMKRFAVCLRFYVHDKNPI